MPANLQTTRSLTCGGPEPFGAELRDPFQGVEVDIDQPELGAEAIDPLEVVPGAPQEVPGHRHPFRGRSLELREVCGLGALLLISYRTTLDAVANFGSEVEAER
jgi:hypothetical protein